MAFNMKEVAALRGNDKLYAENAAKIDWSGVGGKAKGEFEDDIILTENKNVVCFVWRDKVAEYNLITKELSFNYTSLYEAIWKDYPSDMLAFVEWITECQAHKEGMRWRCYATKELRLPSPKTVEFY